MEGENSEGDPESDAAEEGGSLDETEEDGEGAFHSLRHVRPFAREACKALDAAEAAAEQGHCRPRLATALCR